MEVLKPYREKIDVIDEKLVALLQQRFDIVHQVAEVKARENIAPILPDRIDEVCDHVQELAARGNLDPQFVKSLWGLMIEHACDLEHAFISKQKKAAR